jgi:competence protein ComEC
MQARSIVTQTGHTSGRQPKQHLHFLHFTVRAFTLGLVIGCWWLQQQAALPETPAWQWLTVALVLVCLTILAQESARATHRSLGSPSGASSGLGLSPWLIATLWLIAGGLTGMGYAQHRAEVRLAEELPPAWEGRDVFIVGAVASLPHVSERGTRFVVDVEDVLTPGAQVPKTLSLTWYPEWDRRAGVETLPPQLLPGERWHFTVRLRRPHGSANPHGFDFEAWAL